MLCSNHPNRDSTIIYRIDVTPSLSNAINHNLILPNISTHPSQYSYLPFCTVYPRCLSSGSCGMVWSSTYTSMLEVLRLLFHLSIFPVLLLLKWKTYAL
ncbi:hypothetical protein QL285_037716 [Trifolium repens]|nr:hypothetical protein QL285_037716 [Trifolium repens]